MTLEFKRGVVASVEYKYEIIPTHNPESNKLEMSSMPYQHIFLVDTDDNGYEFDWCVYTIFDLFGEGDRVSFLWDSEKELVVKMRLNPFYKEK